MTEQEKSELHKVIREAVAEAVDAKMKEVLATPVMSTPIFDVDLSLENAAELDYSTTRTSK